MKHRVLIVGAGTAGIIVAAQLNNKLAGNCEIVILDPQETHYYQPMWTLIGAGVFKHEKSSRPTGSLIPNGVTWIRKSVKSFVPQEKRLILSDDSSESYDYLVVAPGIQLDWSKIKGLPEALRTPGVCSNYAFEGSIKTFEEVKNLKSGRAIFTQPRMPVKCAGAPQKAMYMSEDYWRSHGVRKSIEVVFANHGPRIFGVEKYKAALEKVISRKEIVTRYEHELVEVRPATKEAIFERPDKTLVTMTYDLLHVVPPQSAPQFIKESPLADAQGWVDVDKFTLQHTRYPEIFGLGDASSLPTSRTGAAIRKQAPVLVKNLISLMQGKPMVEKYNGYTSCPLVTGRGTAIMAEFDYDGKPMETFPFDQGRERWSMWFVKAHLLPRLYWYGMLKGRA
ncbi:MAG: FAD/NAD(P)-binding oxidoreductase [Bacteriovoracia bacterium]